eukprot:TRINITY_DN29284_c0_g1_i1.p1 TRINITY_DN29284_c0_g1~~TRINITY_DN29284_c0_g1_i1.p1  ORF type:complete len:352 (+),score=112.92 TRINITY_DN29284_c0_g1_i1:91-1056(+)
MEGDLMGDCDPVSFWVHRAGELRQQLREKQELCDSYRALRGTLQGLLDRPRHRVMIPVGKLAFFEGDLEHTNDITALLGDSWFALRSVPQSQGMIDRRLATVESDISRLRAAADDAAHRLSLLERMDRAGDHPAPAGRGRGAAGRRVSFSDGTQPGMPEGTEEVLTEQQLQERLRAAGLAGGGPAVQPKPPAAPAAPPAPTAGGAVSGSEAEELLGKLGEMAIPGAAQPRFQTPADIFSSWRAQPAADPAPAAAPPPAPGGAAVTPGPAAATAPRAAAVGSTVVVRDGGAAAPPPAPPPLRRPGAAAARGGGGAQQGAQRL